MGFEFREDDFQEDAGRLFLQEYMFNLQFHYLILFLLNHHSYGQKYISSKQVLLH